PPVSTASPPPGSPATDSPSLTVSVPLGPRSYQIRVVSGQPREFGPFAKAALEATWGGRGCSRGLIVTDEHVSPFVTPLVESLHEAGVLTTTTVLPHGEGTKHLERAADLFDRLVELRADRHFAVIAVGGGVIGDLAGFVAATYAR